MMSVLFETSGEYEHEIGEGSRTMREVAALKARNLAKSVGRNWRGKTWLGLDGWQAAAVKGRFILVDFLSHYVVYTETEPSFTARHEDPKTAVQLAMGLLDGHIAGLWKDRAAMGGLN
jgi:hypothetical protein